MIIDDERTLKYALRSVHMAEHMFEGLKSVADTARPSQIGIAERVLDELEEREYITRFSQKGACKMTDKGEKKLKALGGPFPFWEQRIVASKTLP